MHALLKRERSDREAGFTLIELLVVVAIIGILAAIAIPVFLNQRASARDASVKADLNGIAKVMETVYADSGNYPTDEEDEAVVALQPVTSPGNIITVAAGTTSFTIIGCNEQSDSVFKYDSASGGLLQTTPAGTVCGSTVGLAIAPAGGGTNP